MPQEQISTIVSDLVAAGAPEIEVLAVDVLPGGALRIFIDHPDGVTLDHCELTTSLLGDLRERYALEVSSPGPERPLTKPEHFERFAGRTARLRLVRPDSAADRQSVSGEIVRADDSSVTLLAEGEEMEVSWESIGRATLVAA